MAINEQREVVGWSQVGGAKTRAFVWQNGSMTDLGVLPGGNESKLLTPLAIRLGAKEAYEWL